MNWSRRSWYPLLKLRSLKWNNFAGLWWKWCCWHRTYCWWKKSRTAYDARNAVFIPVSKPFRASQVVHDFFSINGTTPPSTILSPLFLRKRGKELVWRSRIQDGEKRMGKNGTENGYVFTWKGTRMQKERRIVFQDPINFLKGIFMCFQRGKLWVIGKLIIGQLVQVYLMYWMNRTYKFVATHNY